MTWYYLIVAISVASLIVAYIVVSMFSDRKEPKIGKEEFYEKYKDINVFDTKIEKNVIDLLKEIKKEPSNEVVDLKQVGGYGLHLPDEIITWLKEFKAEKQLPLDQIAGRVIRSKKPNLPKGESGTTFFRSERIPPQGGFGTAQPKEIIDLTPSDEQHDGFAPIASSLIGEWEKERDAMVHDAEEKMRSQIELLKAENRKTLRLYYQAMNQVAHLRNKITIAEGRVKDEMSLLVTYSRMPGTDDESANASGSVQRPITVPPAHESGRE